MVRYNHSKIIITHRTLYTCLTHTITTVEVHHIISSIVQCDKCQLSVSIGRPYTNNTNITNGYTCVSNYIIYNIVFICNTI
jgi:ribosomal protein L37AE/L43A